MRAIDADYVLKALGIFNDRKNGNEHFIYGIETAKEIIEDTPTIKLLPAEAALVREGRTHWYCAACMKVFGVSSKDYNYCPYCGALWRKDKR